MLGEILGDILFFQENTRKLPERLSGRTEKHRAPHLKITRSKATCFDTYLVMSLVELFEITLLS